MDQGNNERVENMNLGVKFERGCEPNTPRHSVNTPLFLEYLKQNVQEATALIEKGFEYVTEIEGFKLPQTKITPFSFLIPNNCYLVLSFHLNWI
jgi:hypothetical protein